MIYDPVLAVITRMKSLADLTALVGTRIYRHGSFPTTVEVPYLIVAEISDNGDAGTNTTDEAHMRVQCTCFAGTDREAGALSQLLKKQVPCVNADLLAGSTYVPVVSIEDAGATPDENAEIPLYMRHRDFRIHYAY